MHTKGTKEEKKLSFLKVTSLLFDESKPEALPRLAEATAALITKLQSVWRFNKWISVKHIHSLVIYDACDTRTVTVELDKRTRPFR